MTEPITKAQIAKIWATARELGLDDETLHFIVPRGSIKNLTRDEASDLIEYLNGNEPPPRRRAGPPEGEQPTEHRPDGEPAVQREMDFAAEPAPRATEDQKIFIRLLFHRLGWDRRPERMRGFLRKMARVENVEDIPSRKQAIALIEALKSMLRRSRATKRS